jgi:hypothetical protein
MNYYGLKERIEKHIVSKEECWITDFKTKNKGNPQIVNHGKLLYLSRAVFEINFGEIPKGMLVNHTCGNKSCANPEHLRLISNQELRRELLKKSSGKTNNAKLTTEQVIEIKRLIAEKKLKYRQIAVLFGVSWNTIVAIKSGKVWGYIN